MGLFALALIVALMAARMGLAVPGLPRFAGPLMTPEQYERWAREQFTARHPDEKPLNWTIAQTAEQFRQSRSMGRFVLNENDCSDFIGCVVDHALGAGARFERGSAEHALCGPGGSVPGSLFATRWLAEVDAVQPGDIIGVYHSPWYPPKEDTIGHVGVVGPDGRVIDFVKLKSWAEARYGRSEFEWFIHNCGPDEVAVSRLRAEYRYRMLDVRGTE
ncbi:MAG TPA: hypothetical protein VM283_05425 [Armatimonadota bacterium]|nr:hypothetical protein [Armatimonadota bacterium]